MNTTTAPQSIADVAPDARPYGSRPDNDRDNRPVKTSPHPLSPGVNPWTVAGMHLKASDLAAACERGYADADLDAVIAAAQARKALLDGAA